MHDSKIYNFVVQHDSNLRIDKFIASKLNDISRTKIKRAIQDGNLVLNNKVFYDCSYILKLEDKITIDISVTQEIDLKPFSLDLDIVYEDQYLLVINKPPYLTVHPGAGNQNKTLVNALMGMHYKLSQLGGIYRPGIVHRLDKDTSGLMIVAKDDMTHAKLSKQIAAKEIKRKYQALVYGNLFPKYGKVERNIARCSIHRKKMKTVKEGGRFALTYYRVLNEFGVVSLVECELTTGRTHQIRVHMSYLGHPIVGDKTYGNDKNHNLNMYDKETKNLLVLFPRQILHSVKLEFSHPINQSSMYFESAFPKDIEHIMKTLSKYAVNQC